MDFKTLLVLACVAAGCLAGPVRETHCAEECNSRDDEGMFRAFKSYHYSYAVDIDSRINGTNGDQSSTVRVEALATIEGLSACEMVLELNEISIKERRQDGNMVAAETSTTFINTLMAHPLRFSMESDGTITSVCPEAGEEIWALNVKRGFLSHIQTKRTTPNSAFEQAGVFETSVTGTCMPVYSSTGPQTFLKSNDYLMCKHRTNLNMFVDAIPVHLLAPTASPLSSRMECSYEMDGQGIHSIECHEIHTLKPFAESDSKPETVVHTVITKLFVQSTISLSLSSEFSRRTSLLYEDPIQVSEITSDDVRSTITQICDSVANGVSSETPGLFETLTKQFGELDTDNMNTVINRLFRICPQVQTNEVINMVKDALTDCDTEQCAQGFHSIIRSENSENEFYLRKWFMKLVFHKNPTKNMINLVHGYAQGRPDVKLPAYYALSSMIHQYCRMSEDDCSRDDDILNAARIFEDNLPDSCQPENEEDQRMILMSLRAIGNMGLIRSNRLLTRCSRKQNPDQLRVAAIDAYRRASCDDETIARIMSIFTTIDNDSELRIAAYRASIRCPSEVLLRVIADAMVVEPTNQVTCYVASHLANLRNSQDPMVHDLQMALSQSPLANVTKCGMDYRKFSHNYGLSYFDDESGNGIHFDSDVVFSSKSYLPRSARLAMNVDLFGYAFDLFEMDTRLEGWQDALESFMAPDEDEREANMIEKVKRMMYGQVYRQRREAIKNTAINKIKKEYESSHVIEQEVSQKASFAMKVLGNDVLYKDQDDFQRMAEMFSRERIMEIITSLASQRTHEYSLNRNFKPSKVTIPTMTGMPLEVNIQGAFNTILKASGKLDVMGMVASPRTMTVQGLFEPSAAIEIHSNMMVDAHSARSGLSHKTTLASSLSLGGSLSFENGMLRAKVNAPPRRETIISASSSLYFMQRNELVPVSEPVDAVLTVDETLSNPRYNLHLSGVRPTVPFSLPEAFFHNWALEVTLDKLEENLVSYDLEAGFRTEKAFRNGQIEKTDHIHFLIGAPTSETLGAYSMDLAYHRSNATLIINTESPKGSTYFIGFLRNETNSKRLHLQHTVSGQTFVFEAGMDTVPLTNGWKFVPVFVVTLPNIVSYNLQGHVSCTGEERVWDLSLVDGAQQKLAAFTGDLIRNNTMRRMSLTGNFGSFSGSLQGGYRIEETSTSVMITPVFSLSSPFPRVTLSIGGGPLVISDNGVTMNELYLTSTNTRLIEVSNLHLQKRQRSFGFQGKIKETIPFGIEFDMTNDEQRQYSVDLTLTSIIGEYNVRGLLFNKSSDFIYRLEVITSVNNTEYFNVTTEFKNEINAHQYLDTIIGFRGQQIYRTKNGLQTQALSAKTRYTPIFMLETNQLGSLTSQGSFDVSESGILINNMALVGAEDIFRLSGSASVDRDARSVSWSLNVGGAYITEVISGSASHRDNQVLFQTSMTSESSSQPDYSLTIDLQNSTAEGKIFSWDGKVELNMPHHPELSFRMDTEYTLRPGHSFGDVFRLCYDGIDCTSTEKRITLSHDLTFRHDKENHIYSHDMEVTYTHPAVNKDITLEWTTSCTRNVSSGTQLTLKDHAQDLFTTHITYIPEGPSRNGSTNILLRAPGYFDYEFTDTFHFGLQDILWLSKYRSGQDVMSFLVQFNMTIKDLGFWTSTILEYTDIRNNVFTLEYINAQNDPGNKLYSMTIKKNSDLKMLNFQETTTEISETRMLSHYSYILRTTFQPVQDLSYNQTVNINTQNGNANVDLRLRFMPGQKPISLITHFTNRSTDAKKEGQIITTLSLPKTSITVLTEGKLEKGVPSGNLSIKFQPLMGSTETYAMELTMKNRSSSLSQIYESALIFMSPAEDKYGLRHTVEWSEGVFFPMTSSLTGFWGDEEVTVGSTLTFDTSQNSGELELSLTIPEPHHVYLFNGRFDEDSNSITIRKDSNPIFSSSFSQELQESQSGYAYSLDIRENVMSYGSETTVTLSKTSNAYHFNLQMQENDKEALYTDVSLDLFPDQVRFDLATEARSHYLPGYNTKVDVNYQKTELVHTFAWTLKVEDTKVFGITFRNSSSADEPNSRVTQLTFTQPTNPDFRLRSVVLTDSCSMSRQRITHNTTVMWGSHLPIETIAFNFIGSRNDAGSEATLMLRNEGLVFGFGRYYTLALGKMRTGSEQTGTITVTGETGNIFSLQTELTNRSRDSLKSYDTSITMTVLDRHPITIETSLVHNSMSNAILDADLTITYSTERDQRLTAGIEVTRVSNGHSVVLNLQHLVNAIDVMIFGTYSNSSEMFSVSLENSVRLGDERHQPEITFSLNRITNQVSFMYTGIRTYEFTGQFLNRFTEEGRVEINCLYTGDRTYGFSGQFLNRTNKDGRVYEINCNNTYPGGRVVPYSMVFNEPRRLVGMMVQYNPENPEDIWDFRAGYQNDTAIYASLDTVHSGQTIHNGSIVLSLDDNVPKVLTTQIKWEPSWPQDLKAAVLNIVNKTKELRDEKYETMCSMALVQRSNWKALAQRMNDTMKQFMLANVNIYTRMLMLKTQVETQWALNQPFRMGQLRFLTEKWMQFNQTLHANLLGADWGESSRAYQQFAAEFEDINEYFSSGFDLFSQDVLIDWVTFEETLTAIKDQFDGEAIATHWNASMEAQDAFFNSLWEQFEVDIANMDPNWDALKERLDTIGQNLKAIGPRISEEFNSRIAALNVEKTAIMRIVAAIVEDIQAFNATLRGAVARWEQAAERELEPFRNTDFSWAINLVRELNETIRTLVNEEKALWYFQRTSETFKAPFAEILTRGRRQALDVSGRDTGNLDAQSFRDAVAKFSSFGLHNTPSQVNIPSLPTYGEVVEVQKSACNFTTAILNVLKKVFNGTYELSKLDLVNGEIIFKIFIKDFSNFTSLTNLTREYLDMLPLDALKKINITKVQKMISMLHEGSLSEFKARFMEQFTPNRTYYEELMQELQTGMESRIQNEVENRIIPYLESMGDRIVEGGRPFFGRLVDLPDQEVRQSFLRQLITEMDIGGLERMMGRMKQTMCGVRNTMYTAASRVKMATCPRSWMPPYQANALVIGAKHYMTFDKQFYDFSGKCGYLLAKDFVHENDFSAIVDYERNMDIPIRNMMFMINSTTFEIKSDGTVIVNRQARELPLQVDDTAIMRIGDSIKLKNAHGVSIVCKLPHDVCSLKLKGRYFDRTAGLLGNFNFEPYDDFKTPGNVLQTNITAFTESWKVGKNCIQSETTSLDLNRVIPSMDRIVNFDPLHPDNQACASMFLDNCSPLARCHGAVYPDSFYRMCILDSNNLPEEEQNTKRCSIAAAYRTQCWYAKNPVDMPQECITSKVGEKPIEAGKPVTIKGDDVPSVVDIVFVVEEKRCNQRNAGYLDNLVSKLAGELQDAGYNNTQFGLAAFGGSGVHDAPHPHTINHKIFNNRSRDFPLGRDSLEFADDGSKDTFAAIKLAANYPFRAGAAKHIILLSCTEMTEEDTRLSFEEMSVMLRKRAISLTVLMDYQFRLSKQSKSISKSKSKSKSELVYGIDANSTYTSKMAGLENFKGSSTLRQFTDEPKGRTALLAQESGGAIFDSSMLRDKGFNEVFVKRLVRKSEPEQCQVCRSVPDEMVGVGRSVCEKCVNPLNVFGEEIRAFLRGFELKHGLPHWRYADQIPEEEEE